MCQDKCSNCDKLKAMEQEGDIMYRAIRNLVQRACPPIKGDEFQITTSALNAISIAEAELFAEKIAKEKNDEK